ncbi:hypothetical protein [Andreprevotia lacus]|uniref:hypothetical protein n=1 Tax=Andreprevotia lacus TaxID=1121000 RepID=UPI00111C048B|nr:hypothetical protein [Andreprevotia lacus]
MLILIAFSNRRDFRRFPEKGIRYHALPLHYKALCWLFVAPLFAGSLIYPWLSIPAFIAYLFLEAACTRWYRKAGLWG